MNKQPIPGIVKRLNSMYVHLGYTFDMKANHSMNQYHIKAFKDHEAKGELFVNPDVQMSDFWQNIKDWMLPLLRVTQ